MSKLSIRLILVWAVLGTAAAALPVYSTAAQERNANAAGIPCVCRYDGQDFEQGQCVCISTPNGPRRACCGMVLNNPSWSFKSDGCHITGVEPELAPRRAASTALASSAASFGPMSLPR